MTKQRPDAEGDCKAEIGDLPRLHTGNCSAAYAGGAPIGGGPASAADFQAISQGTDDSQAGACPSITHPQTRQESEKSSLQGVASCDWYESAGTVLWDRRSHDLFNEILRCQKQSERVRKPVPSRFGDGQILVHERGMGKGRASHLEFRLQWCGATIGLSARNEATRNLSNFYLKIPGESCLIHGCQEIRDQVAKWLREWGGVLNDEWIQRFDFCLDMVGLDLNQTIFPAFKAEQFISTARRNGLYRDNGATTGFGIGNGKTVLLRVYDKLAEIISKKNALYYRAMIDRRWGGNVPDAAARVEYQLRSEYFRQFGLRSATEVEVRLPDIVARLTQTEKRPFFKLTDAVPDRKSRHQGRVGVLPQWALIVALLAEQSGKPRQPLKRLQRNLIDQTRAGASVLGYMSSVSAQLGTKMENRNDLHRALDDLFDRCEIQDDQIRLKYEDKARRFGTLLEPVSFPFGGNLAV